MSNTVSKAAAKAVTNAAQKFEKTAGERAEPDKWTRELLKDRLAQGDKTTTTVLDRLFGLLKDQQQARLSHDHSLKRKEPMPPSVRLCDKCDKQDPTRRCQDCGLLYCDTCCTTVHNKGTFTSHSIFSARCDSCEEAVSELSCADCGLCYCTKCSTKVHSKGNLKKHKPASPRTATLGVNLAQFLCKLIVPTSSPQEN